MKDKAEISCLHIPTILRRGLEHEALKKTDKGMGSKNVI